MDNDLTPQPDISEQLLQNLNELVRLQQIGLLGPERVIEFVVLDRWVRLHLPLAQTDLIQRRILATRNFYEARLLAEIRSLIGADSVVVDAGANIGNHTVYFAHVCGARQVHAFEPMRVAYSTLVRNIELNRLDNVIAHNKAVGAQEGMADLLRYVERNTGGTMLGLDRPGTYPVVPIDSLRLERCDLIKMDVEGVQVQAMQGAAETLARCKPLLWVELRGHHSEFEAGNAKMQSLGYRVVRKIAGSGNDYLFGPA